jgi:uncharacterized membrane protein
MTVLIIGLLLFTLVHLYPSLFVAGRDRLVERLGRQAYRGLFSVAIVAGLILIVIGWRAATPTAVYSPPFVAGPVTAIIVLAAFVFFVATQTPTNIKRYVRHPQMLAVILWSVAHLLVNGDSRSVLLFGGLGVWAILEILLCNRRDGDWRKPDPSPRKWDVITVLAGAIGYFLILFLHETLFGVPAAPQLS